jgi:hypothetical protein
VASRGRSHRLRLAIPYQSSPRHLRPSAGVNIMVAAMTPFEQACREADKKKAAERAPMKANGGATAETPPPRIEDLEAAAGDLRSDPDILTRFGAAVECAGLVGETNNAKILYLTLTSRLFERPVSVAIKGVSAGGKSFTDEQVLKFFSRPPTSCAPACPRRQSSIRMRAIATAS